MSEATFSNWTGQRTYRAFGFAMQFRWSHPWLESAVEYTRLIDWVESHETTPDTVFKLWQDSEGIFVQRDHEPKTKFRGRLQVPEFLKREAHSYLATKAPDFLFVHAGVVLAPSGLIVLPGRSWAGKSTLVRALVAQGCRYYSDEFAVIRSDGLVLPFPRSLCLRSQAGTESHISPTELGWSPELGPAKVAAVICTSYAEGSSWKPQPIKPGAAILEMVANTVSAQTSAEKVLQFLPMVALESQNFSGARGEADETASLILDQLNRG
jgi:hypothetical protein